jgi:hypothetical protein
MGYGGAMSKRSYRHMRAEDRETVSRGLAHGHSRRMRARMLGRAPRTVSRESARNTARGQLSRACTAQALVTARVRQPRRPRSWWPRGCGRMCGHIGLRAARPNRLPNASNARLLTTCGSTSRPRPSLGVCLCCHAEPCAKTCLNVATPLEVSAHLRHHSAVALGT